MQCGVLRVDRDLVFMQRLPPPVHHWLRWWWWTKGGEKKLCAVTLYARYTVRMYVTAYAFFFVVVLTYARAWSVGPGRIVSDFVPLCWEQKKHGAHSGQMGPKVKRTLGTHKTK